MLSAQQILRETFGFESFRPGQEAAIKALFAGRNVLVVMPTGSGKSLCYQIPSLMFGGLTVVVSPLVSLMKDQVSALRLAGVAADSITSAADRADNIAAWRRATKGETRILYMAPERLMTERMLAALSRLPVKLFAVDEAHCISRWGPAFRPEYEELCQLREHFPGIPIIALTATADDVTRNDVVNHLFGGKAESFVLGFDRPNIRLTVQIKQKETAQLLDFMDQHRGESGIVYCLSRKKTEETASYLNANGIRALPYHAGMEKEDRETHQNIFMTEPEIVIVATIAFGMGIDKADVRFVFHTDLPGSVEAYYQEIGRAGRDGAPADAHMLYGLNDIRLRRQFIENEGAGEDRRISEHKRLDALLSYCEAPECRRVALLDYFGDKAELCGNCDVCLNPSERIDGTEDAQKILSAISDSGERFGSAHIIDLLRGVETQKIARLGHNETSAFGVGAGREKGEWLSLIRQMVATGFLDLDIAGYGRLAITQKGRKLTQGDDLFLYRTDILNPPRRLGKTSRSKQSAPVLNGDQTALLNTLKALRLQIAKERRVPAYIIFPDRTLFEMAQRRPRTTEEFSQISGVGAVKLEQLSEAFLKAIQEMS